MLNSYLVTTLEYDLMKCTGCRRCCQVCPHGVFKMQDGKAVFARKEACMECGACRLNCEGGAISVDSGVGCAAAMMWSALRGKKEVSCGCG